MVVVENIITSDRRNACADRFAAGLERARLRLAAKG
jgi:hypothetical protein